MFNQDSFAVIKNFLSLIILKGNSVSYILNLRMTIDNSKKWCFNSQVSFSEVYILMLLYY